MKKYWMFYLAALVCSTATMAQNMVPNNDFETISGCTGTISDITPWWNASMATPDYLNACQPLGCMGMGTPCNILGYEVPRSGVGYVGLVTYEDAPIGCPGIFPTHWREYIEVQLTSAMVAGQQYCVQFYVSRADSTRYATDGIGMYISNTPINYTDSNAMPYTPQIVAPGVISSSTGWTLISGTYTASGGEQYIVIGNFSNDANTTVMCMNSNSLYSYGYYYVEDVWVSLVSSCPVPCTMTLSGSSTDETCGAGDGTAAVSPSGGTSPYTYQWDASAGSQTTATATGLSAGSYWVTVSDAGTCVDSLQILVGGSGGATLTTSSTDALCNGACDGDATVTASGGNTPYTYLWDANAGSQTTATATSLCAGTYTVTVTDAAGSGINVFWSEDFGADSSPCNSQGTLANGFNSGNGPWTVTSTGTNDADANMWFVSTMEAGVGGAGNCGDGCGVSGGLTNRTLHLGNSGALLPTDQGAAYNAGGICFIGICVTTNKRAESPTINCTGYSTITLSFDYIHLGQAGVDQAEAFYFDGTTWNSLGVVPTTSACPNGQHNWANFTTTLPASANNNPNVKIGFNWTNNDDGVGTDPSFATDDIKLSVVSSGPGCPTAATVTVSEPSVLSVDASGSTVTDATCNASNGSITGINVSGGTSGYTYNWEDGVGTPVGTNIDLTGVAAGAYSLTVTDANGCTATAGPFTINNLGGPTNTTSFNDALCNGSSDGDATVTPSGGTTPYTYLWDAAAGNQTTATATGLAAGTYSVTVTDNSGCTATSTVTVSEPSAISITTASTDENCGAGNGTATATPSGGTTPYGYAWSSGSTSATATGLVAGNYTVTITDGNSCTQTASVTVNSSGGLSSTSSNVDPLCNGGSDGNATVIPSGGNTPYIYQWDVAAGNQTTATATGLAAGSYSVTVTDNTGCSVVTTVTVTEPSAIAINTSSTNENCGASDGTATASSSGGTGAYTFLWSNGATDSTATGLTSASYSVTVTDNNGCTATASVTVGGSGTVTASVSGTDTICGGQQATLTASGGSTYSWSSGDTTAVISVSPSSTTTYTVTVSSGACSDVSSMTVTVLAAPGAGITGSSLLCSGDSTVLSTAATGNIMWSTGDTTSSITVTPAATTNYSVQVSNSQCTSYDTITVTVVSTPVAQINGNTSLCTGTGGSLTASGGTSYLWNTGDTSAVLTINPASDTSYTVTVTNSCGTDVSTVNVTVGSPSGAYAGEDTTISLGTSVQLNGVGGAGASFVWDPADFLSCSNCQDPVATPPATTTYVLFVTDNNGCSATDTVVVSIDLNTALFVPNIFSPNNDGENDILYVYGKGIASLSFIIYDRWGEKVFEGTDITSGWDGTFRGKKLNPGVFVYVVSGTFIDGNEFNEKGNVTLVR